MRSNPVPTTGPGSIDPIHTATPIDEHANRTIAFPKRMARFAWVGVMGIAMLGVALSPTGAQAFGSPELTCSRSWDLVQSLLKRHISFRGLDTELRKRAIDTYIERIDPSKTLYLSGEITRLRSDLAGVFFAVQNGECEILDTIQTDLVGRYERMQKEVTAFVSKDDYAVDPEVRLILDPDKRGHPADEESRKRLVERLVHFQISNYLASDMALPKAKERLIHRYELMTKRAQELDARDTYGGFLNAFAGALDPHSAYYSPEEVEDFNIQMSLSLDGIGVALSSKDGYSIVERIIPGGATDKSDALQSGDKIIAVAQEGEDPVDIIDKSLRDVVSLIRGKRGSKVKLTVLRKAETTQRLEVEIVRDKVTIEDSAATVDFHEVKVGDRTLKLAVLDLPTFYGDPDPSKRQSGRDVRDLLRKVREEKADGVLLDLSRNGGGKLDSSVDIGGLFIRDGGVVAVKNVFSEVQVLSDPDDEIVYTGPLVILTSRITASASEIVAGALKDYGRAVVVGDDHTFGKGTVQSFINQPGRLGAIKVTTQLFFRPGGASTQHSGVEADVILPSLYATDDLGERYTPYSLGSQKITPFLAGSSHASALSSTAPTGMASLTDAERRPWAPIDEELIDALRKNSASRVQSNEAFSKISEQLAKYAAEEPVIHLAEVMREREEAEAEKASKNLEGDEAASVDRTGEPENAADEDAKESDGEAEDDEPTPQRLEALNILADLVTLQETARSQWPALLSASRSESPSSLP